MRSRLHVATAGTVTAACALSMVAFYLLGDKDITMFLAIPTVIGAFATGLWFATSYIEGTDEDR